MSSVPRIARAVPAGAITRSETGIPVVARLRWASGQDVDVVAVAIAWTQEAVEVRWVHREESRTDWVPAADVRRSMDEPVVDSDQPPTSRGQLKKSRW
jgi:hypothetical protein